MFVCIGYNDYINENQVKRLWITQDKSDDDTEQTYDVKLMTLEGLICRICYKSEEDANYVLKQIRTSVFDLWNQAAERVSKHMKHKQDTEKYKKVIDTLNKLYQMKED